MWTCPKCGAENNNDDAYCTNCCSTKKPENINEIEDQSPSVKANPEKPEYEIRSKMSITFNADGKPFFLIAVSAYIVAEILGLIEGCIARSPLVCIVTGLMIIAFVIAMFVYFSEKEVATGLMFIFLGGLELIGGIINTIAAVSLENILSILISVAMLVLAIIAYKKLNSDCEPGRAKTIYIILTAIGITSSLILIVSHFVTYISLLNQFDNYEDIRLVNTLYALLIPQSFLVMTSYVLLLVHILTAIKIRKVSYKIRKTTAPAPTEKLVVSQQTKYPAPQPTPQSTSQLAGTNSNPISENKPEQNEKEDAIAMLKKLKELRDQDILTEEEYKEKRQKYIDKL